MARGRGPLASPSPRAADACSRTSVGVRQTRLHCCCHCLLLPSWVLLDRLLPYCSLIGDGELCGAVVAVAVVVVVVGMDVLGEMNLLVVMMFRSAFYISRFLLFCRLNLLLLTDFKLKNIRNFCIFYLTDNKNKEFRIFEANFGLRKFMFERQL